MPSENRRLALVELTRRYAAAFGACDADAVAALLHDDVTLDDPVAKRVAGKTAVMVLNEGIFASCPTMTCEARSVLQDGDTTVLEFILRIDGKAIAGTDLIEWRGDRIAAIRAYVNP